MAGATTKQIEEQAKIRYPGGISMDTIKKLVDEYGGPVASQDPAEVVAHIYAETEGMASIRSVIQAVGTHTNTRVTPLDILGYISNGNITVDPKTKAELMDAADPWNRNFMAATPQRYDISGEAQSSSAGTVNRE